MKKSFKPVRFSLAIDISLSAYSSNILWVALLVGFGQVAPRYVGSKPEVMKHITKGSE